MQTAILSRSRDLLSLGAAALLVLLFFFIPIEHKYDKLFRFYSLTLIPEGLQLPHHFDKKIYFYFSDLAALFLFGLGVQRLKSRFFPLDGLFLTAVFFFALLSLSLSPLASYPIPYTRLLQLFTPFALFLFLRSHLIPKERLFQLFSFSLVASGLVQAAIASSQYFAQKTLDLRFFGEQPLGASIPSPGGRRWLFDAFSLPSTPVEPIFRAMGTMPHPNVLGGLLAISLLLTGHLFSERRSWRLWLAPCYVLQLFALATTYSRSAIFAYLIALLIWFIRVRSKETLLLIGISALFMGTLFSEQYLYRGGIVNYTPIARGSDQVRLQYQSIAESMIESHPLAGVGYGQFSIHAPLYGADPSSISATHNIYLILAAETGLLSLAAFLGWIGVLLFNALRSQSKESHLLFAAFCGFLFIGLCDFYPIAFHQGALLFFGTAGLLAAQTRIS